MKAAWIVKELQGVMEPSGYLLMLEESLGNLNVVLQSTDDVKDSVELATKLRNDIEKIKLHVLFLKAL